MATSYTTLLGLALPVTGELSGTWGDTVNNYISNYIDAAVAGAQTVTTDTTLTKTTGSSLGATSSQYAIIIASPASANITITAPAASKIYTIINTSGTYTVKIRGAGPTTGVTLGVNEKAQVAWNGSDFVRIGASGGPGVFSSITNTALTSGRVVYSTTGGLETDSANLLYSGTDLTVYGITVGRGAGAVSTNTAVGAGALAVNTTGYESVAVGSSALDANTTGFQNVAVGQNALTANTTGTLNVAVGTGALQAATTADTNTAVGSGVQLFTTTGAGNTSVGRIALFYNTTGGNNVAIGKEALFNNTTASNNTAVGFQAGYGNTTGDQQTLIGASAGRSLTTGVSNTYIGAGAGYNATTGSGNTCIGSGVSGFVYPSGYFLTTGSKNSILGNYNGNQGGLDIRTASNYIVLSDGDGNPRGVFDASGNFGIGTSTLNSLTNTNAVAINIQNGYEIINHASGSVSGSTYAYYGYNAGVIGSITQSGTTAVLYNVTSDQRLKENIVDAPEFGSVIDSFQVRSFDWKADNTHQRAGFVAQELVTVAPEAVHQPADPEEMMAVDYSKLVPMLVKEIQSLRKRLAVAGIA